MATDRIMNAASSITAGGARAAGSRDLAQITKESGSSIRPAPDPYAKGSK